MNCSEQFNLEDAFAYVKMKSGSSQNYLNQSQFREALIKIGVKASQVSMDRIFLFFKRFNIYNDNRLNIYEFSEAISPINR